MKMTLERTALDLLGLPSSSRAFLAEKLLASLEDEEPSDEVERAWKKEALKRHRAFKSGKVAVRPHAEVMREAYRLVGGRSK
ncbi:MAG TPA: addiction module protein [Verrucomicrobiae bacterium]